MLSDKDNWVGREGVDCWIVLGDIRCVFRFGNRLVSWVSDSEDSLDLEWEIWDLFEDDGYLIQWDGCFEGLKMLVFSLLGMKILTEDLANTISSRKEAIIQHEGIWSFGYRQRRLYAFSKVSMHLQIGGVPVSQDWKLWDTLASEGRILAESLVGVSSFEKCLSSLREGNRSFGS